MRTSDYEMMPTKGNVFPRVIFRVEPSGRNRKE